MRVFVLGTGRCGTTTFIRACEHFDNFTAGHETRVRLVGPDRFEYPDQHIEADNRLSFFLGSLGRRYDGSAVFYVHLRRDRDEVIRSFQARWHATHRTSIIRAFSHAIVMRPSDWPDEATDQVCAHYVDTVTDNITEFLRTRPSIELWLHELDTTFADFTTAIHASGALDAARAEFGVRHNATVQDV